MPTLKAIISPFTPIFSINKYISKIETENLIKVDLKSTSALPNDKIADLSIEPIPLKIEQKIKYWNNIMDSFPI